MSACIIARHRAIGRPGVGGVAGRQGGGLSEGQAGSGRQAAQRTPPPREGAYLFLAIAVFAMFQEASAEFRRFIPKSVGNSIFHRCRRIIMSVI